MIYKCLLIFLVRYDRKPISSPKSCEFLNQLWIPDNRLRNIPSFIYRRSIKADKIMQNDHKFGGSNGFRKVVLNIFPTKAFELYFFAFKWFHLPSFWMAWIAQQSPSQTHEQCSSIGIKKIITPKAFILDHRDYKFHHSYLMRLFWQSKNDFGYFSLSCYLNICRHSFAQMNSVEWFGSLHLNILLFNIGIWMYGKIISQCLWPNKKLR